MKFSVICATAVLALGLISCGGKNAEDVKKVKDVSTQDLTEEQIELGLTWALEYQQQEIDELQEELDNVEENLIDSKAAAFAARVFYASENENSEVAKSKAYADKKEQLKENKQKIEALQKDIEKAKEDKAKELGLD